MSDMNDWDFQAQARDEEDRKVWWTGFSAGACVACIVFAVILVFIQMAAQR